LEKVLWEGRREDSKIRLVQTATHNVSMVHGINEQTNSKYINSASFLKTHKESNILQNVTKK